jgi:hypothetical protein
VDGKIVGGIVAVALVAIVAQLMRGSQSSQPQTGSAPAGAPPPDADEHAGDGDGDDDDEDEHEHGADIVAVTSDGYAVVPDRHAVRLLPPEESGEEWKVGAGLRGRNVRGEAGLAMSWHAADFTGARIVHGAADEGPWRLEALGREGEYAAFVFETPEGAEAALAAFTSRGIIKLGEDEDGNPAPPSTEQFEEARRVYLETEQALEMPDEDEPRT